MKFLKRTLAVLLILCTVLMLFGPWLVLDPSGEQRIGGSPKTLFTNCLNGIGQILSGVGSEDENSHVLFITPTDALSDAQISTVETWSLLYWLKGTGEELRSYTENPIFKLLLSTQADLAASLDSALSVLSRACKALPVILGVYLLLCLVAILGTCSGHYNLTWLLFVYTLLLFAAYCVLGHTMNGYIASLATEAESSLGSLLSLLSELSDSDLSSLLNGLETLQNVRFVTGLAGLASVLFSLVSRIICFLPEKE